MKINKIKALLIILLTNTLIQADSNLSPFIFEQYADSLKVGNQGFIRTFSWNNDRSGFYTISYRDLKRDYEYWREGCDEFSFRLNGYKVKGSDESLIRFQDSEWQVTGDKAHLKIELTGKQHTILQSVGITLHYQLYKGHNVIRKWLEVSNNQSRAIKLDNIFWEDIRMDPWGGIEADIYGHYGRYRYKPPHEGGRHDPALFVKGVKGAYIVGNEAPAITKRTGISYQQANEITIGLNPSDKDYAIAYHLKAGESFTTPKGFVLLSDPDQTPQQAFTRQLRPFITEHLGFKFYELKDKPALIYNTWHPFMHNINTERINELATSLQGTGVEYFIIDDGWSTNYGDWKVDKKKFPKGLKPVMENIRAKGMKPGLWITLSTVETSSEAFEKYKDYAVKGKNGKPVNLHQYDGAIFNKKSVTISLLSPYYDYMMEKVTNLVEKYGLKYLKVDFATAKSAYVTRAEHSGSYDTTQWYQGRSDFFLKTYRRVQQFFDQLSQQYPELIIDATFELWGDWYMLDYGLLQHAHVDWISNYYEKAPQGPIKVRKLAYSRGGVLPTSCMMIGNQAIDADNYQYTYYSQLAGTPLLLGDPRNLSEKIKEWYKEHTSWFEGLQQKYDIQKFYSPINSLGAPENKNWDGFLRYNSAKQGGFFAVFRNDSPEKERKIALNQVDSSATYKISSVPDGKQSYKVKGEQLHKGWSVNIPERHSAKVFSISVLD